MRIRIDFQSPYPQVQFTDSMNAALVAALVEAGLDSKQLVGESAQPWTFGMVAQSRPGKKRQVKSVILASPSASMVEAFTRLQPAQIAVHSCNGDVIDGRGARILPCDDLPPGVTEVMINFVSPFLLPMKKQGRDKTRFHETLPLDEAPMALKAGLDRRAGQPLDLSLEIDWLAGAAYAHNKHLVHIRRFPSGKKMILPGFMVPITLRGAPDAIRFAYLAGFGAKTRNGNGCPMLMP